MAALKKHLANWRANPRRAKIGYVISRILAVARVSPARDRAAEEHQEPLDPPVETEYVNILSDPVFSRSISEIRDHTCLDVARLANLWNMVEFVGPGSFLEVGSFQGGTALHICNAIDNFHPGARFYSFDPFETGGFERMSEVDKAFKPSDFMNTRYEAVAELLSSKPLATVTKGFFPAAAAGLNLGEIAFCHLDVDIYNATKECLEYVTPRLASRGLIVLDDVGHQEAPGVEKAMREFVAAHPSFVALPMFPCQAILLPKTFWQS